MFMASIIRNSNNLAFLFAICCLFLNSAILASGALPDSNPQPRSDRDLIFLVPKKSDSYQRIIQDILNQVGMNDLTHEIVSLSESEALMKMLPNNRKTNSIRDQNYTLYITLGNQPYIYAANKLIRSSNVISGYAPIARRSELHESFKQLVVFQDTSVSLLIDQARRFYGPQARIGFFYSEESKYAYDEIADQLQDEYIVAEYIHPRSNPRLAIKDFIAEHKIDVFLFIPSFDIYDNSRVSGMLYFLYQNAIAGIGYTDKMVGAYTGALSAVFYSPKDINAEIAHYIRVFFAQGKLTKQHVRPKKHSVKSDSRIIKRFRLETSKSYTDLNMAL